jgi:hypothetical protein
MKKILVLILILALSSNLFSQGRNAIGVRISTDYGLTFKHRFKGSTTLEGLAHFGNNSITITGLYEKNRAISSTGNFHWFYGGGAYVGLGDASDAGIAGIIGICYRFKDVPFDISVDWLPRLQIIDEARLNLNGIGLSLRFTF